MKSGRLELLRVFLVIAVALLLGFVITLLVSDEPLTAYSSFLTGPLPKLSFDEGGALQLKGMNRFGNWLEDSITLIFLGLAVAVVFSARQFSMGAEGQMFLGAMAAAAVSLYLPLPGVLHIALAFLAAALAGFLWGLIPGLLKAYVQANEIVSTLMLNIIAIQLYRFILTRFMRDSSGGIIATPIFPDSVLLPIIIPNTRVSVMLILAVLAVFATWFFMHRTSQGYELRMIGLNQLFAIYGGIKVRWVIALSMALSGIWAGLAGAHLSMGLLRRLTIDFAPGLAFEGIVVALLARNRPIFILFSGLFYGYLRTGAQIMERSSDVSREVVQIIQAVIILFITAERLLPWLQRAWQSRSQRKEAARVA